MREVNQDRALLKIQKCHGAVRSLIVKMREEVNQKLDEFEGSIDCYA